MTPRCLAKLGYLPDHCLDPLFNAVADIIEAAVIDSMITSPALVGANGLRVNALSHDQLIVLLERYQRLSD